MDMKEAKQELQRFALDHYEEGGHWVYECWDTEHYEALIEQEGGNVETAKRYLQEYWGRVNEQEAETRWE